MNERHQQALRMPEMPKNTPAPEHQPHG